MDGRDVMLRLKGKLALITGGASGLGAAFAHRCVSVGTIAIAARLAANDGSSAL